MHTGRRAGGGRSALVPTVCMAQRQCFRCCALSFTSSPFLLKHSDSLINKLLSENIHI